MVRAEAEERNIEGGGCGGVVLKAEGVWGVVYKVGEIIQVGVGKGWREPGFVPTLPPRGRNRCARPHRCVSQGWDPAGLELGAGWVRSPRRRQTMGRPHFNDTA